MARLLPLTFHVDPATWGADDAPQVAAGPCRFCDDAAPVAPRLAASEEGPVTACLHCRALHHLGRDTVAQEGLLIWAPQVSQAALNWMIRAIHRVFLAHGETPALGERPQGDTARLRVAYRIYEAWEAQSAGAMEAVNTTSPRELGAALLALPSHRRAAPAGLRLLHRGRHFVGGQDVYPLLLASANPEIPA